MAAAEADRHAFALDHQFVAFVGGPDRGHRIRRFAGNDQRWRVRAPEHHVDRAFDDDLADRLQGTLLLEGGFKAIPAGTGGGHIGEIHEVRRHPIMSIRNQS